MNRIFLILCLVGLAACSTEEVSYQSSLETKAKFFLNQDNVSRAELVKEIRGTTTGRIDAAFQRLNDNDVANAIVAAHKAGATVRIVGDVDYEADSGFAILVAAGVPVVFGDGELRYLPDPTISPILDNCGYSSRGELVVCPASGENVFRPLSNGEMVRPSDYNLMSHTFIRIGERVVWNFASPLDGSTTVPLAFRIDGEAMSEAFEREFNQLYENVFSISIDVYNGPVKSGVQYEPTYLTEFGEVYLRFSPQDRVTKTVIDEVYKARASVFIMTNSLSEDFLLDALDYKKNNGFDVRIIVNQSAQDPDSLGRLTALGVKFAPASVDYLPTVVVLDTEPNRRGDIEYQRAHVASHPLWKTAPFAIYFNEPNDEVEVYKSDYFVDGVMWSLTAYPNQVNAPLNGIKKLFNDTWNSSTTGAN